MYKTLTVGTQSVQTVVLPAAPGFKSVELGGVDAVALIRSPFTGKTQTLRWAGGEEWVGAMTLPTLSAALSPPWKAALLACNGMEKPFLLGDPSRVKPQGHAQGVPVVDGTVAGGNLPNTQVLYTKGWVPSAARLLLPGDHLQIGFRLHMVLDVIGSDGTGAAAVPVWPSLRETPAGNAPVILASPKGLFRRAANEQRWQLDIGLVTSMSFQVREWR